MIGDGVDHLVEDQSGRRVRMFAHGRESFGGADGRVPRAERLRRDTVPGVLVEVAVHIAGGDSAYVAALRSVLEELLAGEVLAVSNDPG